MKRIFLVPLAALLGFWLSAAVTAADFPPITDQERSLTSVDGEPNAPAAVLFRKAELRIRGYGIGSDVSSRLVVSGRVKVLTEAGKSQGEISLGHSNYARLQKFEGRTVQPDGRVLPLPADAKFERKVSKRRNQSVTSVAFPGVEVGSILDYAYEIRFDSIYFLEPWYFADEIPVLHSEITFMIPHDIKATRWSSDPYRIGLQTETKNSTLGTELRVWADKIPSVADDPYGLPFADLALKMMVVPTFLHDRDLHIGLLDSWTTLCKNVEEEEYGKARRKDGGVAAKAKAVAGSAPTPRAKAEALYRFVRDEIQTEYFEGIFLDEGSSVANTLSDGKGDYAEKALLLQALLDAVKIDARLVWAGDRFRGQIDPALPNPLWFDRVLVMVPLDGQRVFLDPADRSLAFGQLQYGYEGVPALVYDAKKPEGITLPETPFDQNGRRAMIDLALDTDGRLTGTGELVYTGHLAWEKIDWQDDEQKTLDAWKEWLGDRSKGFEVSDIKFQELPDERKVRLTWTLKQREEDVLGDEVTLAPSLPLGPLAQPFVQDVGQRRSPVLFPYGKWEEVELHLRWPEGWKLEATPDLTRQERPVGALVVELDAKDAERTLVYRRHFEMRPRTLSSKQDYEAVRALYAAAEKSDAQMLALVRR